MCFQPELLLFADVRQIQCQLIVNRRGVEGKKWNRGLLFTQRDRSSKRDALLGFRYRCAKNQGDRSVSGDLALTGQDTGDISALLLVTQLEGTRNARPRKNTDGLLAALFKSIWWAAPKARSGELVDSQ